MAISVFRRLRMTALHLGLLGTLITGAVAIQTAAPLHSVAASSTLKIWYATDDPVEQSWAGSFAQSFQKQHPEVKVQFQTYGLDDMNDKMSLALSSGNVPDLIYTTPRGPGLAAYVHDGKLLDLTTTAKTQGWAANLRSGLLADYNHVLAGNGPRSVANHIFGVPYIIAAVGVLYNKQIFSKLHLSIPHSLGALAAMLPRIKKAGYTPLGFGNADGWVGDDWLLTLVNSQVKPSTLASVLDLNPRFTFERPEVRQAGIILRNWADQNYFTHDFGSLDAQDSVDAFFDGHTAMQLISSTQNSQILSGVRGQHLNVGVFAFPSLTAASAPVMPQSGYAGWAIPRAAHNVSAAVNFISSMLTTQTATTLLSHGLLPAHSLSLNKTMTAETFQREFLVALQQATPGVYLDSAPVPNLNATMEANVQLLLQGVEEPTFLAHSLQLVYSSRGVKTTHTRTDGEF